MILALIVSMAWAGKATSVELEPFSGLDDGGVEIGCMTMTSGHVLKGPKGFGGYSGIDVDPTRNLLTLLSDAGHLFTATLTLGADGTVLDLTDGQRQRLERPKGETARNDTEGLARLGDDWLVSREGHHDAVRVTGDDDRWVQSEPLADFSALGSFARNGSFESVAALGEGSFILIPENQDERHRAPVIRWTPGEEPSIVGIYQGEADFSVTGLSTDHKGEALFIVERAFSRAKGPRAKVKVLPLASLDKAEQDQVVRAQTLGKLTFFDGADNMEGIAHFVADDGSSHVMLISDDNFSDIQRTVLMTLRINEGCFL